MLRGGKYNCADLDDTTRSQVYRDGQKRARECLVDSARGIGIMRNGAIVTTEYSAENGDQLNLVSTNHSAQVRPGGPWPRHVPSGSWPGGRPSGKDAEWMVSHYFPGAIV